MPQNKKPIGRDEIPADLLEELRLEMSAEADERISAMEKTLNQTLQLLQASQSPPGADPQELGKALAEAMAQANKVDLYKRSRGEFHPVPDEELLTPFNFDIFTEAGKIAEKLGHTLGTWHRRKHDNPSPFTQEVPEDWISTCRSCGATALAQWMPPASREQQKGRWWPTFGGPALVYPEGSEQSLDEEFAKQYPGYRFTAAGGGGGVNLQGTPKQPQEG